MNVLHAHVTIAMSPADNLVSTESLFGQLRVAASRWQLVLDLGITLGNPWLRDIDKTEQNDGKVYLARIHIHLLLVHYSIIQMVKLLTLRRGSNLW